MTVELRDHLDEKHIPELMALYRGTYWGNQRTEDDVRKMLAHTDLVFALVDERDHLVGFARVLTDTVYKALVFDVMVRPDRRGSGLARTIFDSIDSHPQLAGVKHFELYCRPDVIDMYRKWGYGTELGGQVFMRREGRKGD